MGALTLGGAAPAIAAALVGFGLLAGTVLDDHPHRPVVVRGGYRVLEADFHAHTRFSDGFLSPFDLVLQARRRGLDALAITEHNTTWPAELGRWFSGVVRGPIILVGEEVTTNKYHLHGVGLTERLHAGDPLPAILAEIHRQGGVAIAAHPVRRYWPSFDAELGQLDATEVMHPLAYGPGRDGWRWNDFRDFYAHARELGHPLTAIGSSDYHFFSTLGICRTLVFAEGNDAAAVLDALKKRRTVVYDLEGNAYGDPELAALLVREPIPATPHDYGYRGSGPRDRVTRALGWLGLVGMLLFGMRRRRQS